MQLNCVKKIKGAAEKNGKKNGRCKRGIRPPIPGKVTGDNRMVNVEG